MGEVTSYRIDRKEGCNCPEMRDVMPFRIADLTCPVHGVDAADGGDGYWKLVRDTRFVEPDATLFGVDIYCPGATDEWRKRVAHAFGITEEVNDG